MCTVSYIPQGKGYLLTVNRDESPERATLFPGPLVVEGGKTVYAPRDELKGGTWVALDETGRAVCLLNGAFDKHKRMLPYRKSRGHYVLEAMGASDFQSFISACRLCNIEPFTMLLVAPGSLYKLVWDGVRKYSWQLPPACNHLWSSPTLYSPAEHAAKEKYFKDEMASYDGQSGSVLRIHGSESTTPFILHRPGVRTLSITQLFVAENGATLQYYLKRNSNERASLNSTITVPYLQGTGTERAR